MKDLLGPLKRLQPENFKSNILKSIHYIRKHGINNFIAKAKDKLSEDSRLTELSEQYRAWIEKNEPDEAALQRQRKARFAFSPKISVVVPVFKTPPSVLREMVDSVIGQTYRNLELCVAECALSPEAAELLNEYAQKDKRIKVKHLSANKGIAGNSSEALALATGEYIGLLDHDDTLAPFALYEVAKLINADKSADFIYSDEDKISEDSGERFEPHFKPEWSPDTLRSYNYICHFTVIRRGLIEKTGGFREGFDGSQDYDLFLRATEEAQRIVHIPKVLYHWRVSAGSTAGNLSAKSYALASAKRALKDHLERRGVKGEVYDGAFLTSYRVSPALSGSKVTIIIPNRDSAALLDRCVSSILKKTAYRDYEILIAENNSREEAALSLYERFKRQGNIRVIEWNEPFNFSAINNFAASQARGQVLLFMNNDMEVLNPEWLQRMLEHAERKDVGVVGAKLYYPDDTVQHAGVIVGVGGVAGHSHKTFPRRSPGYMGRLNVVQNLSAVTGACLMTRKEVFEETGGFDEGYALSFNDVDICLRVREKGYLVVWTPFAELYHFESKTRGYEDTKEKKERFRKEADRFKERWSGFLIEGDPYYSPNLTLKREDFSIRV